MSKRTTAGARYLRREKNKLRDKETVIINHVKRESELVKLKSGAVKRAKKTNK